MTEPDKESPQPPLAGFDEPNSRRRPLAFESREEAQEYAKRKEIKVWAKIWSWCGVFEIYPGGREVWHKNW